MEEEGCDILPSFPPSFLSLSLCSLLPSSPSNKVGQHYTSVQHAGGEEGEDLSCERDRWGRWKEVREWRKKTALQREKGEV